MTKNKLCFIALVITAINLLLVGCGLRVRTADDISPYLRTLYLDTPSPYSPLSIQLQRLLTSLHVHLTKHVQQAPVTLSIINHRFSYSIPTILYSGNAATYSYSLTVTIEIKKRNGQIIYGPKNLNTSRLVLQNANQLYAPNSAKLVEEQLTCTMVTAIYNQLTALKTQRALHTAFIGKTRQ